MPYKIEYKSSVVRDLKKLDKNTANRILLQLEKALSENPNRGDSLTGQFKGLFKYQIGSYRVIAKTTEGVLILRIGSRGKIYK